MNIIQLFMQLSEGFRFKSALLLSISELRAIKSLTRPLDWAENMQQRTDSYPSYGR